MVTGAEAPLVLKIGGRAFETVDALDALARELAAAPGRTVIVHGGGPEVTAWSERLGLTARFEGGRRVTDPATLEVATAVLAGLANKRLAARLLAQGVRALGLSALDGALTRVEPHPDAATLGAVGQVTSVDTAWLAELLSRGLTPVVASIGAFQGGLLNVNADDLAAALAAALKARSLVLLSDTEGLVLGGQVVAALDLAGVDNALARPEVTGGMKPKLAAARTAVTGGAREAWIASWHGPGTLARLAAGTGPGTRVTLAASREEVTRG
jgi:acetylglutamate kinase